MTREELVKSKEYIVSQIQLGLLNLIGNYKDKNNLKDYELAKELGVSKGYVSQVLNASFDHKISKVVDLALACNAVPIVGFVDINEYVKNDANDKVYCLIPMNRPRNIVYKTSTETKAEEAGKVEPASFITFSGATVKHTIPVTQLTRKAYSR